MKDYSKLKKRQKPKLKITNDKTHLNVSINFKKFDSSNGLEK